MDSPAFRLPQRPGSRRHPLTHPRARGSILVRTAAAAAAIACPASLALATDGEPTWVARYDGPEHRFDQAHGIAAFPGGGCVVTGESDSATSNEDVFVARYGADGSEFWTVRYDGPNGGVDRGLSVAVDPAGRVYVTGQSWGSEESEYDIVTLAYGPDGTPLWEARYDGTGESWDRGVALAVGGTAVFVTGWETTFTDGINSSIAYVTLAYDLDGTEVWSATYTGPGSYDQDRATDIVVTADGNVVVTGESYGASTAWDYATIAYRGEDGAILWVDRYDFGVGSIDGAAALAIDASGNTYVTGYSYVEPLDGTKADVLTLCYDPDGRRVWTARYDGPVGSFDGGTDVAVDGSGVVVVGQSVGVGTSSDFVTLAYEAETGTPQWEARLDGLQGAHDFGMHVALDAGGEVCVTGEAKYVSSYADLVTVKYDRRGTELWCHAHSTPANTNDFSRGLVAGEDGALYVSGTSSYVPEGVSWDAVTLSFPGSSAASVEEVEVRSPATTAWPNPTPPSTGTSLSFDLARPGRTHLGIYDIRGRLVQLLLDDTLEAGRHERIWDGRDESGRTVAAGTYFYRLGAVGGEWSGPIVRLR